MNKNLILVAAPPACGKNYVSEMICRALGEAVYLDKDALSPLLRRSLALCGKPLDMDGEFYINNLRPYEYETLFALAFSALRFSNTVLVNAPLLKEVRDEDCMRRLRACAAAEGARLILVWVHTPQEICYKRMKERNSDRDQAKLASWETYVRNTDYRIPEALQAANAVDALVVFDNESEQTARRSLDHVLSILRR